MATNGEKATQQREGDIVAFDLAAGAQINKGAMVVLEAGYAKPGHEAAGLKSVGIAEISADHSAGANTVFARRGTFLLRNGTGADEITRADIESQCFILDDDTVAKTDGGGTRSRAGTVRAIEGGNVWVTI